MTLSTPDRNERKRIEYRGFYIQRGGYFGWEWCHEDYDGAPYETGGPPGDKRYGSCSSMEACKREIDEYIDENEEGD